MTIPSHLRFDETLQFLHAKWREEMAALPKQERIRFGTYCRRLGIILPQRDEEYHQREISSGDIAGIEGVVSHSKKSAIRDSWIREGEPQDEDDDE